MKIFEVADPSTARLFALAEFLLGRANDTSGQKQISKQAFVKYANDLGVPITPDQLQDLASKPPLNQVLLPVEPNSDTIQFKGAEPAPTGMPVNKAQDIVAAAAKKAASKDRSL